MPPERLLFFEEQLHGINPDIQQIPYNILTWNGYFQGDLDFAEITQRFPDGITRGNIKDLSIGAINDHTQFRKFFLATMIWGYGTSGFGAFRTSQMLNDALAPQMIQMAVEGVIAGQILNVYEQFGLRFCGPAFFTKFFYFIGLGGNLNPLPLIFDSRVAQHFRVLANDEGLNFADFARVQENKQGRIVSLSRYPEGYVCYVNLMNQWAHELNCRPDSIELFLFDPPEAFLEWHGG